MSFQTVLLLIFLFYYRFASTITAEKHCGEYGFRCVNTHEYEICPLPSEEEEEANQAEGPLTTRSCTEGMTCDEENPSYCSPSEQTKKQCECDLMKSKRRVVADYHLMSDKNNNDYKIEDEYVYAERGLDDDDTNNEIYRVHDDINLNFIDMDDEPDDFETTTETTNNDNEYCKSMDMDIAKMFSNPHDCTRIAYFPGR